MSLKPTTKFDGAFLQFMRDQGAQRAYRNVAEWLKTDPILGVVGRIEVELTIIDARREAFHRGKEIYGQQERQEVDQWKEALKERKAARPAAKKSKRSSRRPTR